MIHIIQEIDGTFSVIDDDMVADKLGWDEMLGLVAARTKPDSFTRNRYMRKITYK